MVPERCETCYFFRQVNGQFGECQRRAPIVSRDPQHYVRVRATNTHITREFPHTDQRDWCGDYKQNPACIPNEAIPKQ